MRTVSSVYRKEKNIFVIVFNNYENKIIYLNEEKQADEPLGT